MGVENSAALKKNDETQSLVSSTSVGEEENENSAQKASKGMNSTLANKDGDTAKLTTLATECAGTVSVCKEVSTEAPSYASDSFEAPSVNISCNDVQTFGGDRELSLTPDNDTTLCKSLENARHHDHTVHEGRDLNQILEKPEDHVVIDQVDSNFNFGNEKQDEQLKSITHLALGPSADKLENALVDVTVSNENRYENSYNLQGSTCGVTSCNVNSSSQSSQASVDASNTIPGDNTLSVNQVKEPLLITNDDASSDVTGNCNQAIKSSLLTSVLEVQGEIKIDGAPEVKEDRVSPVVEEKSKKMSSNPSDGSTHRHGKLPPLELMPWRLRPIDVLKSFRPKSQPTEDKSIKQMTPPPATTEETNVESSSSSSDKEASHVQFNNEDLKSLLSWVTKRNASGESLPMNVDNISLSIKVENTTASECMSKTSSATDTIDSNNRKFYRDPRPFHLLHESDTTTSQTPSLLPTPPIQTPNPNTAPVCIDLEDEEEESKPKGPPLIHRKSHDRYNAMMEAEKKKSEEIEKERLASQKAQWSAWQLKHYNRQNINISRVNNYINYNIRGVLNGPPSNISLPVRPLLSVPPPALLPVSPLSPLLPPPPPYSTHASPLHPTLPAGIKSYPVGAVMQGNMTDPLQLPQVSQSSNLPSAASSRDPRLAKRANASIHGALPAGVTQGCGQDPSSPLTKITYCLHCKWQGSPDHSLDHYVNVHPDKDPPVRLSKDQLEEALYERDAALRRNVDEKTPTGVRWLDDLSWIPVGSVFLIPQKCKLCSFTTNIRCSLIQHVYNHRQMMLAPASCSTIVGDDSTYRCRFCEMTTKSMEEFHKHCTLHTGEYLFACGGCPDFRGPTREDVQKHIQEKHAGRNTSIKFNDKVKLQGRTLNGHMCSDCLFLQLNEMKVQNHVTYAHYPRPAEVIKVNMSKRFLQPCNTTPLTQPKEPDPVLPQKHTSMTPSSTVLPTPLASLLHSSVETTAQSSANGLQIAVTTATSDEPDQQAHAASRGPVRRPPPVKIRDDPRRAVSKLGDGTINKDVTNTMSPSRKSPKAKKGDNLKVKSAKQKATKKSGPRNKKSLQGEVGTPSSFTSQRLNVPTQRSSGFNYQDIHSSALNTDEADEVVVPLELGTMECEVGPVFENNNYNETNEPDYMNVESHQGDPIVESVVSERNSSGYDSDASTDTVEMNLNSNDQVLGVETAPVYQVKTEPVDITEKHQECHRRVSVHEEASSPGFRVDQTGGSVPSIADTILKLDAQLRAGRTQTAASQVIPANELLATSKSSLPNVDGVVKDVAVTPKKAKNWSERQKVIICSCLFAARSTEAFVRHRECWHKGEKRCTCPECHNRFDTAASYAEHLWTACPKSRMYACAVESLCRFTTSSPNHFVTHIKEEHLNIPWLPCYWCGSTYNTPECLVVHIQNKCSLRTPLMNALMKNAATLSAPAIELPATSESEGTRCAIRGPKDSRPDYTGVCSPEDSTAPHLEIVYRCSVPQCAHQSLEREVFIDHVQVDHPEKTVHVCHDCGENFQSLFSLVLHIEKHHREGCLGRNSSDEQAETHTATVSVTPKTLTILSSRSCTSASTPPERNIVEPERMPVVESGLSPSRESPDPQTDTSSEQTTSSNTPVSHNYSSHVGERPSTSPVGGFTDSAQADRMLTNSLALASSSGHGDDGEEGAKTVKLDTVANLCKFVALTCEVIFSRNVDTSRLDEMLVQWNEANRRQNCSFVIPELRIVDPLKFPLTLKTSAALSSMLSEQGLVNLYKCPGKECQFTSNDEDEFQCHLEMGTCHTKDRLLQCLYCGERHLTVWGAVAHLSQQHGSAVFQCPDCIFRSSRNLYVILHIVLEHPQHRGHARVIKCKNPIKDGDCAITNNPEDDLPSLLSVILPIPCTFGLYVVAHHGLLNKSCVLLFGILHIFDRWL